MTILKKKRVVLMVMAILLAGCSDGEDGRDGAPGEPGTPGEPGKPGTNPPVTQSVETQVKVINYTLGEGKVSYEFEVTDENGDLINELTDVQAKVAALTAKGFILNRDENPINGGEDNVHIGGAVTQATEGATLTQVDDGHYIFEAPMAGVNAATEGIVWLRVGGNDAIARSKALVVNKPEGQFSTTTEACYACHVDYSLSPRRHASYVAEGMDGEVDFVAGCLVCHGSVSRAATNDEGFSIGGYATNTLSKIGHINHREFSKDFSVLNCSSCHTDAPINSNFTGPGCIDCHGKEGTPAGDIVPSNGLDFRELHEQKAGITKLQALRLGYTVALSTPESDGAGGWCSTISVKDKEGNLVNIGNNYNADYATAGYVAAKPIVYAGAYLHAYDNHGLVGRPGARNSETKTDNADGTRTVCYAAANIAAGYENAGYMFSARVTFSSEGWQYYDGKVRGQTGDRIRANGYDGSMGVSFTAYSDVISPADGSKISGFDRRQVVADSSCITCHNDVTAFHKNGEFDNGGKGCIACHGNGMARTSADYGAGFGPMIHSWHWGKGATVGEVAQDADGNWSQTGKANGAAAIAPASSCVACHQDGLSLAAVPNQYILEPGSKMTSPVTANCYACHTSDSAKAHMSQNGGDISVDIPAVEWFKQPSAESCATCHDTGRTFGIDKYHKF
ncbi:multiheme c-type cytochrome [Shewanella algae]|uniref:multiheme c-type cytochrome n=1 Tax=Shewanella algae TaxID=38313 RepID=UPI0012DD6AFF|nr:cytochrome c3 family protein [Shewanella algae]QGS59523.1 cytochrome C [Shewanella algae]